MSIPSLLTVANPKTLKGEARNYLTAVLHLAPFNLSGVNVCPMAELAGCVHACLNTAGHGGIARGGMVTYASVRNRKRTNPVQRARIARTRLFLRHRDVFMARLAYDVARHVRTAKRLGLVPCVRLNGTSDIRWENIPALDQPNIFAVFPTVQFYDYTKIPNRRRALTVPNYHLTFSYSHRPEFAPIVAKALATYGDRVNIAAVFPSRTLPAQFLGRPVINGDAHDLRFLDSSRAVVGLYTKGNGKRDRSGFVVGVN